MAEAFQLFAQDAVEWLGGLVTGSVPLVVLDPGVPGRAPRRALRGEPAIAAFPERRLPALLYEVARVLARSGLCWWVTETAQAFRAARVAERLGLAIGAPLVWDRGDGPGASLAFALPLTRGRPRSPGAELVHAHRSTEAPTSLPQLLCDALIEAGSARGDVVVDPFMGRGALGVSALTLGRGYLGNDLAPVGDAVAERLGRLGAMACEVLAPLATRDFDVAPTQQARGIGASSQLTIFGDGAPLR